MGSLALRPDDSLTIPRTALSVGFIRFVSSTNATQATGLLTLTPAGLPPAEHASLRWTRLCPKTRSAPSCSLTEELRSVRGGRRAAILDARSCGCRPLSPGVLLAERHSWHRSVLERPTSVRKPDRHHSIVTKLPRSLGIGQIRIETTDRIAEHRAADSLHRP